MIIIVIMIVTEVISQMAYVKYRMEVSINYEITNIYFYISIIVGYLVFGACIGGMNFRSKPANLLLGLVSLAIAISFMISPNLVQGEFYYIYGLGIQNKLLLLAGLFLVKSVFDSIRGVYRNQEQSRAFGDRNRKWDTKDFDY